MRNLSTKAAKILARITEAGADGVPIIDIAHHYGVGSGNIDCVLTSFENHGILVAEQDNRLCLMEHLDEPEEDWPANKNYDYFYNRYR